MFRQKSNKSYKNNQSDQLITPMGIGILKSEHGVLLAWTKLTERCSIKFVPENAENQIGFQRVDAKEVW